MPKIMFRPAPTPPPFVPPTPPAIENSIHFTPYPFDEETAITIKLSNLNVPQALQGYEVFGVDEFGEDVGLEATFDYNDIVQGEVTIQGFSGPYSSLNLSRYILVIDDDLRVNLTLV
jgi:hypothetical protein